MSESERTMPSNTKATRIGPWRFHPADDARRFLLVTVAWTPRPGAPARGFPRPHSLVDVPQGCTFAIDSLPDDDDARHDRPSGLDTVADANRAALQRHFAGVAAGGDAIGCPWAVLIEIGQAPCSPALAIDVARGGIGVLRRTIEAPLRLLRPTVEERRAFPIPEFSAT